MSLSVALRDLIQMRVVHVRVNSEETPHNRLYDQSEDGKTRGIVSSSEVSHSLVRLQSSTLRSVTRDPDKNGGALLRYGISRASTKMKRSFKARLVCESREISLDADSIARSVFR